MSFRVRLFRLFAGFVLIAFGIAFNVRSNLGLGPLFIVFDGVHEHLGITIGTAAALTNAALFLVALLLRQRPGMGTLGQVFLVGPLADVALLLVPHTHAMGLRVVYLGASLLVLCCGAALYLSAGLGAGPYDAVMWGLVERTRGRSLLQVRVTMEMTALLSGWLLGGEVGVGTVVIGLGIGPGMSYGLKVLGALPRHGEVPSEAVPLEV